MQKLRPVVLHILAAAVLLSLAVGPVHSDTKDVDRLVAALLGDTPLIEDLRELCDEIGGRPTGSKRNEKSTYRARPMQVEERPFWSGLAERRSWPLAST